MEESTPKEAQNSDDVQTLHKYFALINMISDIENRLKLMDLVFFTLNTALMFLTIVAQISITQNQILLHSTNVMLSLNFLLVSGEAVCVYWVIVSMRLQLKLKLRYFQARALERKMNKVGEFIITQESHFFRDEPGFIESFDGKERTGYPHTGPLRMDGFVGKARPRYLAWAFPSLFFFFYLILLLKMSLSLLN